MLHGCMMVLCQRAGVDAHGVLATFMFSANAVGI